jgi:hypothetical protein
MLFQDLLSPYYSSTQINAFFSILSTSPSVTTIRVNTLKYTAIQAKALLEAHFAEYQEPFQVQISPDFPDLLLIPSIRRPSSLAPIEPSQKGTSLQ